MRFLSHLVPAGGLMLSILMSAHTLICLLLGLVMLPIIIALSRHSQSPIAHAANDPYTSSPAAPPAPAFYVFAGMAMAAVATFMVTRLLPLPDVLMRNPFVAGGFYYCLGALIALSVFFFYLAWSAKRGAAQ